MIWTELLGPELAGPVRSGLMLLNMVPVEKLTEAIGKVSNLEAIGPMMDPSAWTSGERFKRSDHVKDILNALVKVRKACEDLKRWEQNLERKNASPEE